MWQKVPVGLLETMPTRPSAFNVKIELETPMPFACIVLKNKVRQGLVFDITKYFRENTTKTGLPPPAFWDDAGMDIDVHIYTLMNNER